MSPPIRAFPAGANQDLCYPPFIDFTLGAPLLIHVGDTITTTCTWKNTLGKALYFPDEMCAAFGYTLGAEPEHGCADGIWNN